MKCYFCGFSCGVKKLLDCRNSVLRLCGKLCCACSIVSLLRLQFILVGVLIVVNALCSAGIMLLASTWL